MTETKSRVESTMELVLGLLLAALLAAGVTLSARPAHAAETFTVNSTFDGGDLNVGDGVCDVITSAGDQCGLRAAIQEANHPSNPSTDTIEFNIGGGIGVKTISPRSELPQITEQLTINGYSQPGATGNTRTRPGKTNARPLIELDGSNAAGLPADGLDIRAANVVVRGLVINRFPFDGIDVRPGVDNLEPTGVKIEGNFIGTDATGTRDLGNGGDGVLLLDARNNTVGGTAPETRNLISGNGADGVGISSASGTRVEGNLIGTGKDGTFDVGNGDDGVGVSNSDDNTVGGTPPGTSNTIAFNKAKGVEVSGSADGNRVLGNAIFLNAGLGIDLEGDGRTDNDDGDPDPGANSRQNFPNLASATASGATTAIEGVLNSTPGGVFKIQFFSNPPGEDEGKTFLGETDATADGAGNAPFAFAAPSASAVGEAVTATATSAGGDTSEFSGAVTVRAGAPNTAPTITRLSPAPGSRTRDATPTIEAKVTDRETNLRKGDITLSLDGRSVTGFAYDATTDRLSFTSKKLEKGEHTVKIRATDARGRSKIRGFGFEVVAR